MGGIPTPQATTAIRLRAEEAGGCAPPVYVEEPPNRLNFVTVNVDGYYSMDYVAILRDMVLRNCTNSERDIAWWCITDRPDELPEGVNPIPADPRLRGWWIKVQLFSPELPFVKGDRCVYFDLDVAITGRLEDFVETKGIIQDWHWPCYNSSVMAWDHGEHATVWTDFTLDITTRSPGPIIPAKLLPADQINSGDQEWITECAEPGEWQTFPEDWFPSYRSCEAWPPNGSKAVILHGKPKPHEITDGWVRNVWKIGGYTSFPEMNGANVTPEFILQNVTANLPRDVPWFTGQRPLSVKDDCVLVCGGPSMKTRLKEIRDRQRRGARIITVNNALRFLMANGIKPHAHVMLDARPENVEFLQDAPHGVRYLLATQCHPTLFEALAGHEVVMWHNYIGDDLRELLQPYWNTHPIVMIPGGGTVGLRAMNMARLSGFKRLHVYGMDGSYSGDDHHAYPQALNEGERTLIVEMAGKQYRCAFWMVRQAEEFRDAYTVLSDEGVQVFLHGEGLIPDIWRGMRAERKARVSEPPTITALQAARWGPETTKFLAGCVKQLMEEKTGEPMEWVSDFNTDAQRLLPVGRRDKHRTTT